MTKGSISNHNVISVVGSVLFLLVVLPMTRAAPADNPYKCANLFMQPVTREFFMHGSQEFNLELVESTADFVQQCHGFQQFDQTKKAVMLSNLRHQFDMNLQATATSTKTTVHIYDFRLVTGDVYIDLGKKRLDNPKNPLIINLVARQFVTFNLFNLSSDLTDVTILLSGECNLEVRNKKEWLKLNVAHAPVYDEIPTSGDENYDNTVHSTQTQTHRAKWINYLSRQLGIETRYYVEYLTMLCHVRHLFITPSQNSVLVQYSDWNYEDTSVTEYLLIKKCDIRPNKLSTTSPRMVDGAESFKDEFYMFEFDSYNESQEIKSPSGDKTIRIYLKDCAFNKRYNIVVFFNSKANKPTNMILDTDICRINILYTNVDIIDLFGVKWQGASKSGSSKESVADSLKLSSYYLMKLVDYAAGLELRFNMDEATDKMIKTTHAFSNLLALQLFIDESHRASKPNDLTNTSIKFLVADKVIKAHFAFRNLNMDQFVKSENVESKKPSTRFVIIDANQQPCPLVYLRRERTTEFSLLFNSDLFDKCAIPYDTDLETYLLTLKFNFYDNFRSKFHSSYFTIKAKQVDPTTPKTVRNVFKHSEELGSRHLIYKAIDHRTKMISQIRKRAKEEYFTSVISNTLESHYAASTELHTGLPHQEAKTDIQLASMDDQIRWQLGACWLMSMFNCNPPSSNNRQRVRRTVDVEDEEMFDDEHYDDTNHEVHYEDNEKTDSSRNLEFLHTVKHTAQTFDYKRLTVRISVHYEFNSTNQPDDDTDKFLVCKILPCSWTSPDCSAKLIEKQRLILINYFNSTHSPQHYFTTPAKFFFDSSISFPSSESSSSKCLSNLHMIYQPPTNDTSRPINKTRIEKAPNTSKPNESDNSAIIWLKQHTLSLGFIGLVLVCIVVCLLLFKLFFKNFHTCYHDMFKKRGDRDQGETESGQKQTATTALSESNATTNHINNNNNKAHLIPTSLEMEDKEQSEKLLNQKEEPVDETTPAYLNHNDFKAKRNFVTNV